MYIIDYMIIPDVYTCIKGFIDIYLKMAHNKGRLNFLGRGCELEIHPINQYGRYDFAAKSAGFGLIQ